MKKRHIWYNLFKYFNILLMLILALFIYSLFDKDFFLNNIWYFNIFTHFALPIFIATFLWFFLCVPFLLWKYKSIHKDYKYAGIYLFFAFSFLFFSGYFIASHHTVFTNTYEKTVTKLEEKRNSDIFYQNIWLPKSKLSINQIYQDIEFSGAPLVAVVENSHEFNREMEAKGWKRYSGSDTTECAFYGKHPAGTKFVGKVVGLTDYQICLLLMDNTYYLVTHIHPPVGNEGFTKWKKGLEEVATAMEKLKRGNPKSNIVLMGDFNATKYNPHFISLFGRLYEEEHNLLTWTAKGKTLGFLIPSLGIDHVLFSERLQGKNKVEVLPSEYSDHSALLISIIGKPVGQKPTSKQYNGVFISPHKNTKKAIT